MGGLIIVVADDFVVMKKLVSQKLDCLFFLILSSLYTETLIADLVTNVTASPPVLSVKFVC